MVKIEDTKGNCYDTAKSFHFIEKSIEYRVGAFVEEPSFNTDREEVCAKGIHYFVTRATAESYGLEELENGMLTQWHDNGQKSSECIYRDGYREGLYQSWHDNGQKSEECTYRAGALNGLYQYWYESGQKMEECTYRYGMREGLYQSWNKNGQKREECTYREGELEGRLPRWYRNFRNLF